MALVRTAVFAALLLPGAGTAQDPRPAERVAHARPGDDRIAVAPFGLTIHYVRPLAEGPTFAISQVFRPGAVANPVDLGPRTLLLRDGPIVDVRTVSHLGGAAVVADGGEDCASKSLQARTGPRRASVLPASTPEEALMIALNAFAFAWQLGFGTAYPPFCDCASGACASGSAQSCQLSSVSAVPDGDISVEAQRRHDRAWIVQVGALELGCECACM